MFKLVSSIASLPEAAAVLIDNDDFSNSEAFNRIIKELTSATNVRVIMKELLQFSYAGLTCTQRVFVDSMAHFIPKGDTRSTLMRNASGRELLKRLVFSTTWNDKAVAETAKSVLDTLISHEDNATNFKGNWNATVIYSNISYLQIRFFERFDTCSPR